MSQLWLYELSRSSVCAQHRALFLTSAVTGTMLLVTLVYCVRRCGAFHFFSKCASVFATRFFYLACSSYKKMTSVLPLSRRHPVYWLLSDVVFTRFLSLPPCNTHITRMSVSLWLERFTVLKRVLVVCIDQSAYTQSLLYAKWTRVVQSTTTLTEHCRLLSIGFCRKKYSSWQFSLYSD